MKGVRLWWEKKLC